MSYLIGTMVFFLTYVVTDMTLFLISHHGDPTTFRQYDINWVSNDNYLPACVGALAWLFWMLLAEISTNLGRIHKQLSEKR